MAEPPGKRLRSSEDSSNGLSPADQLFQRFLMNHEDPKLLQEFHVLLAKHLKALAEDSKDLSPAEEIFHHILQIHEIQPNTVLLEETRSATLSKVKEDTHVLEKVNTLITQQLEKQRDKEQLVHQEFSRIQQLSDDRGGVKPSLLSLFGKLPKDAMHIIADYLDEEGLWALEESNDLEELDLGSAAEREERWAALQRKRDAMYMKEDRQSDPRGRRSFPYTADRGLGSREKGIICAKACAFARSMEEAAKLHYAGQDAGHIWPKQFYDLPLHDHHHPNYGYFCRLSLECGDNQGPWVAEGFPQIRAYGRAFGKHNITLGWVCLPNSMELKMQEAIHEEYSKLQEEASASKDVFDPMDNNLVRHLSLTVIAVKDDGTMELVVSTKGIHKWNLTYANGKKPETWQTLELTPRSPDPQEKSSPPPCFFGPTSQEGSHRKPHTKIEIENDFWFPHAGAECDIFCWAEEKGLLMRVSYNDDDWPFTSPHY